VSNSSRSLRGICARTGMASSPTPQYLRI
jgi:hypothetical protein